jgi:Transposase
MGEVSTIGLDIAKSVFQVHGVDVAGAIRKHVSRAKLLEYFGEVPPCLVGIEACPSARHWGRELQRLGHTISLIAPGYVKAYLKRGKNDANDAAAICEAVTRPSMRFVPIKTKEQQTALMLHRTRQLLVRQRTMLSNALRGSGDRENPLGSTHGFQSARFCLGPDPRRALGPAAIPAASIGRTRDRTRPMLQYVRKFLPARRPHVTRRRHVFPQFLTRCSDAQNVATLG